MKIRRGNRNVEEKKTKEELKRRGSLGVLNIQLIAIKLPLIHHHF
jgi:hypothetical protein